MPSTVCQVKPISRNWFCSICLPQIKRKITYEVLKLFLYQYLCYSATVLTSGCDYPICSCITLLPAGSKNCDSACAACSTNSQSMELETQSVWNRGVKRAKFTSFSWCTEQAEGSKLPPENRDVRML